jgi:hypothetical protein
MDPALKSSLLWGLVGALSFLVLLQGYHAVTGSFVGVGVMLGVAALVGVCSAVVTHLLRGRLQRNERP